MKYTNGRRIRTRRVLFAAPVLMLLTQGCEAANEGTLMTASASLTDSTCGSGAVQVDDDWSFQIRIKIDGTAFTWYDVTNGTSTQGSISDGDFSVSDSNDHVITVATNFNMGCTVRRHDKYSGTATLDKSNKPTKLQGDIVFKYSQSTGYNCDSLIGASDGFDDLPCEIDYTFMANPAS